MLFYSTMNLFLALKSMLQLVGAGKRLAVEDARREAEAAEQAGEEGERPVHAPKQNPSQYRIVVVYLIPCSRFSPHTHARIVP
jgi:quercetin dioxygenase-like cupin family protein